MKILLDENFPLGLVRVLQQDGHDVEHIITLGWRGAADARIRERLQEPDLVFLTQDADFIFRQERLFLPICTTCSRVAGGDQLIIARNVKHRRDMAERVGRLLDAIQKL